MRSSRDDRTRDPSLALLTIRRACLARSGSSRGPWVTAEHGDRLLLGRIGDAGGQIAKALLQLVRASLLRSRPRGAGRSRFPLAEEIKGGRWKRVGIALSTSPRFQPTLLSLHLEGPRGSRDRQAVSLTIACGRFAN